MNGRLRDCDLECPEIPNGPDHWLALYPPLMPSWTLCKPRTEPPPWHENQEGGDTSYEAEYSDAAQTRMIVLIA